MNTEKIREFSAFIRGLDRPSLTAAFEVVIAQAAIECGRRYSEDLGGLATVPASLFQSSEYLLALDFSK